MITGVHMKKIKTLGIGCRFASVKIMSALPLIIVMLIVTACTGGPGGG